MPVIYQGGSALAIRNSAPADPDPVERARVAIRNAARQPGFFPVIREALIDYYHLVEDRSFQNLSLDPSQYIYGQDFTPQDRRNILSRLRNIARANPVAKQTLRLICTYTFGNGLQVKSLVAKDRRFIRPVLIRTWSDPYNKRTFASVTAQYQRCVELVRDGDLFFVARTNPENGMVRWGRIDAARVDDIVTDPEDVNMPRWYKVRRVSSKYDFRQGTYYDVTIGSTPQSDFLYFRDWEYTPQEGDDRPPADLIADGVIYHEAINQEGKFGVSELYASMDWYMAHKSFMEDRASYTKALSTIAWKVTRKDTPAGISAAAAAARSTLATSPLGGWDLHPVVAAGSTLFQNQGENREPVSVDTGAANAVHDAENLLQMAVVGGGIVGTHYVGSTNAHRLATVTAMELPMLKLFEWWQQVWQNIYQKMLQYCVDQAIIAGVVPGNPSIVDEEGHYFAGFDANEYTLDDDGTAAGVGFDEDDTVTISGSSVIDRTIRVEFPPILTKDLAGVVNAVRNMIDVLPLTVESRELVASIAFTALGVDDVEDAIRRCFPKDGAVLLPANSTRNSIVKVLPNSDDVLDDSTEEADNDDSAATPAWEPPAPEGDDAGSPGRP